ncbi:MAG: HAMP domain-containing histidine kinase [Lachnospiraceae bacterium]|nr:HAMP domain-containing histidine kinase [Lachnospiraceae bacterium]
MTGLRIFKITGLSVVCGGIGMRRTVIYICNTILIMLAILCGYVIFYLNNHGIYRSSDFYESKMLHKAYYNFYGIQYELDMLYANSKDSDEFLKKLDDSRILMKESNIRIRFTDEKNQVLKENIASGEKVHLVYGNQLSRAGTSQSVEKNIFFDVYLTEPLTDTDEFYGLNKKYRFFQKVKIPVLILEAVFIILIILLMTKNIRHADSSFPADIAIGLWLITVIICSMLLYQVYKSNNYIVKIIFSGLAGLIQYSSVLKIAGLTVYQRKKGIFYKNMVLSGLNHKVKYLLVITGSVLCQSILSYFFYQGKQKWLIIFLQIILFITEIIFILSWIGRNNIRLNEAVEQQMQSERLKTELITNVSHDIKTPVTSIINYVDLIKKENLKDETIKKYVEVIDRQSLRLKKLVMDVIEASKAATGNISPEMNPLDIRELLNQAIGEYEERLRQNRLEVVINTEKQPKQQDENMDGEESEAWMVMADGDRLWRVFDNLLSNICKYSAKNTRVYIELQQLEKDFVIIFKNISKDRLNITEEELFERFVRGDASRHTEGSGLGLTIARSLTELMDGKLVIEIEGDMFRAKLSFKKI